MNAEMDTERLDLLILARVAGAGKRPPGPADVRKDLLRFVGARWSAAEWRARLDQRIEALRARGDLAPRPPLAVTDAGRARVARALGLDPVPGWSALRRWLLPALALGLAPDAPRVRERLSKADGLRAAALRADHELPGTGTPTQGQAVDALAWKALGVDTDRRLSLNEVRRHLLVKLLGQDTRLDLDKLVGLLAAKAAGAARPDADALRDALVRGWLERGAGHGAAGERGAGGAGETAAVDELAAGSQRGADREAVVDAETAAPDEIAADRARDDAVPAPIAGPADATAPMPGISAARAIAMPAAPPPAGFDLAAFARAVQRAADDERHGRFGERKVFIAAVWRRLRQAPLLDGMDLAGFKRHLVDANRADLLALHRADLVAVMDPDEVRASEIAYGNATFHFIESPFRRR